MFLDDAARLRSLRLEPPFFPASLHSITAPVVNKPLLITLKCDDLTGGSLEALFGTDVTISVCSPCRVSACAWLNAETSHVKCFNPKRVQTVPDSVCNRRASRRACFQQFLQLAGVKNVEALDLARPSHHHHLRLPLSINIGEIAGRLIGIVGEVGEPESLGSCVVPKENGADNDRCSDHSRKVAAALPLRHSCHQFVASLHHRLCRIRG